MLKMAEFSQSVDAVCDEEHMGALLGCLLGGMGRTPFEPEKLNYI